MKYKIIFIIQIFAFQLKSQFPGPVGTSGTTAMHKDSSAFVAWATTCKVMRGYQDINNTTLGYTTVGDSSMALGKAGINGVVSLGDGGIAVLTFDKPITNGPGFDFAVFENAFNDTFLELAFVEVSSDGVNFFRFSPVSNSQTVTQFDNAASMDAAKLNNLAGKYRGGYGTPFDLQELSGISQLNINQITHVKITDVVGSLNTSYATYDKNSNIINDPWPTPFASSGFDLDAIGVIHQSATSVVEYLSQDNYKLYPNPVNSILHIVVSSEHQHKTGKIKIFTTTGNLVFVCSLDGNEKEISVAHLNSGVYFLEIQNQKGKVVQKLIKE